MFLFSSESINILNISMMARRETRGLCQIFHVYLNTYGYCSEASTSWLPGWYPTITQNIVGLEINLVMHTLDGTEIKLFIKLEVNALPSKVFMSNDIPLNQDAKSSSSIHPTHTRNNNTSILVHFKTTSNSLQTWNKMRSRRSQEDHQNAILTKTRTY